MGLQPFIAYAKKLKQQFSPEISIERKELTSEDLRLINKPKSEEDIYESLTENTDSAVYYIYEIWKLMDKFKEEK